MRRPCRVAPAWSAAVLIFLCLAASPLLPGFGAAMAQPPCAPTPPDAEGPFYRSGAPERSSTGTGLVVRGRILGAPDCRPLPEARIEWWHAAPSGRYDDAHRGSLKADPEGTYRYSTDFPGKYPGRSPHIHFKAFAPGYRPLTTQLFLRGAEKQVDFDIVLVPLK